MIESPLLERFEGYIDGQWVSAASGETRPVIDPATGEVLARVPHMGADEANAAIEAARRSLDAPRDLETRRESLLAIRAALADNKEALASIITLEQGKPLAESRAEVEYAASFFDYFSRHMHLLAPQALDLDARGCRWTIYRRPAGVAGLITPWNFPLAMLAKKLAPAIAAGCGIVAKPASETPLTAIALWGLLARMDFAPGAINLVLGDARAIGGALCAHPAVRVVSCTGSTETGKTLMRQAAEGVKRLSLELGGNAPFIVFEDADLEAAARALMANKFRCAGQTCVCTNRVYAHAAIAERFVALVAEAMKRLKVGHGLEEGADIGPLIHRRAFEKVARHVADALEHGAVRVLGHDAPAPDRDWGCYYPPTLLTGVSDEMRVFREETFGPVVAVSTFESEPEIVLRANSTPYGLAAYVFSGDGARARRVAERLAFGHVGLNTGAGPTPEAPFGGMKQSGFGREGGEDGLMEYIEPQVVAEG